MSDRRHPRSWRHVWRAVATHPAKWYRIGTAGDHSHDWQNTISVCQLLRDTGKLPVIITKHWIPLSDVEIGELKDMGAVVNTSVSGLDSESELGYRVGQLIRLREAGIRSVCRVVTCSFGTSECARSCKSKQDYLISLSPIIDNPLRVTRQNPRVLNGDIMITKVPDAVGGGKLLSLHREGIHTGTCEQCPDQCGVEHPRMRKEEADSVERHKQIQLFNEDIEWEVVQSVIGSGYEGKVSDLAIRDVIAKRAARENMQIHSAVILKIGGVFSGFFTFQVNSVSKEFCLLQSVIEPTKFTSELYEEMARRVLAQNKDNYPALITTDPKSKFETPSLFESLGFQTYLKMSGFCYMVKGDLSAVRMKLLAHITMTNVWNSTKGDWLRLKQEWRDQLKKAGDAAGIVNPEFATRDGCWQGEHGFANVVTRDPTKGQAGRAHNGNASVLDPVACEVIVRFFMPTSGRRVYNPFAGGVQFGYVSGACGFEYLGSEIRKNQCDANNRLCSDFPAVRWVQSDSSTFDPQGMFDLVFTCPPYYKVERYVDYDGKPPPGEINSCDTYEEFRELLFAGYRKAIQHLNSNCFFVVMTGDSRDKYGAYYCSESETEMFIKHEGLSVYNKIVYLEAEFTRLAQAKKTLHMRKFPKREQKIIVAYKGDIRSIKELYAPIGRL